jgi:hypothetical protein
MAALAADLGVGRTTVMTRRTVESDQDWMEPEPSQTFGGLPALALAGFMLMVKFISFHWLWGRWKDKVEAQAELRRIVAEYGGRDYGSWKALIHRTKRLEFTTDQGNWYQGSVRAIWDDQPEGRIRVLFAIDDGGSSAFFPMTDSLLIDPPTTMPADAVQQ